LFNAVTGYISWPCSKGYLAEFQLISPVSSTACFPYFLFLSYFLIAERKQYDSSFMELNISVRIQGLKKLNIPLDPVD